MADVQNFIDQSRKLAETANELASQAPALENLVLHAGVSPFVFGFTVFVMACFVGYFVVWKVTPALHTPLMAVTNAISGIIVVGAIIAAGAGQGAGWAGFLAVVLASVNIFGGFVVTQRMLVMFKKKEGK